jgi:chemotaxis protein CheX
MNVELINPFLKATLNVLETMAQTTAVPGKPVVKTKPVTWGVVNGVIGMAGDKIHANFVVSFDQASIIAIVSRMLMEEISEVNHDVVDAVGEITNMIVGAAKVDLGELGYNFEMSIPMMVVGPSLEISQQSGSATIQVPFKTPEGQFVVEATAKDVSR